MKAYTTLLLDIDNTLLDFSAAERNAILQLLQELEIPPREEVLALYSAINDVLWKRLERGELSRDEVIYGRFRVLLQALGHQHDVQHCQARYQFYLCQGHRYMPGAREFLEQLQGRLPIYLLTNGLATTQAPRLRDSGLQHFAQGVFISEEVGYQKPQREFYEHCFARIPGFQRETALMVGDSLSSDILGGNNAGVDTCWFNPKGLPNAQGIPVTYEIQSLSQLLPLLATSST